MTPAPNKMNGDIEQASNGGAHTRAVVDVLHAENPADPLHRLEEEGGFCFSTFLSLVFLVGNVALGIYLAVYSYLYPGPPLTYAPTLEPASTASPTVFVTAVSKDVPMSKGVSSPTIQVWLDSGIILEGSSADDFLGSCVAVSGDGLTLAAGAIQDSSEAGFVDVFTFENGQVQSKGQELSGAAIGDEFGGFVSLSYDGDVLAVGARGYAAVYYFEVDGDAAVWTQLGDSIPVLSGDLVRVTLSGAGDLLALGSPSNNTVQVMRYSTFLSDWVRVGGALSGAQLPFQPRVFESFGSCVDFSSNGAFLAVGGPEFDSANVYQLLGGEFVLLDRLLHGDSSYVSQGLPPGTEFDEKYGASMALTADGDCVIVGAPGDPGYAKVSCNSHDGLTWYTIGNPILAPASGIQFGVGVALSMEVTSDPTTWTAVVGADMDGQGGPLAGAAFIYRFVNGDWVLEDSLVGYAGYGFGNSIAMSENAEILVVGASNSSENGAQSGEVRIFRRVTCPLGYSSTKECAVLVEA